MYKVGEIVEGIVSGIQNYGAFVTLPEGIGLVHISEISNNFVRNIEDYLQIGKSYKFYVIDYDNSTNQTKLSYKKIHEEEERKTRIISKTIHINKKQLYFKETYDKVLETKELLETPYLVINYKLINNDNLESFNILDYDFNKYPSEIMEKDILRMKLDGEKLKNSKNKFVVVGSYFIYESIESYCSFLNIDFNNIIFINSDASISLIKEKIDLLNDCDFVCLFIFDKEYSENSAIIYRLLRKKIEEYNDTSNDRIYFCYDEFDEDINALINKEWYVNYINPKFDEFYNLLSPGILFTLSYLGVDIFNILQGYRKAIIDINNQNIISKIIASNSNNLTINSNYLNLKKYLNLFKNLDLSINFNYKLDTLIQLPKYKDHLTKLKSKDGKYINEKFDSNYDVDIIINNNDPFTLGYLSCLLYTLKNIKESK